MTTHDYPYLLPQADTLTQPFWDAARRHALVIQECSECSKVRHPPTAQCSECGSETYGWRTLSGRGSLYSYVIVHQTALPDWRGAVPYNIVMVTPEEAPGLTLYGNVVQFDDSQLKVGLPLVAVFDDVTTEDTIIRWRVADAAKEA